MNNIQYNLLTLNNMLLRNTSKSYTKLLNIETKKFIDLWDLDTDNIYKKVIIGNKETKIYTIKLNNLDKTLIKSKLDSIHSEYDKGKKNSTTDLYIGYYFIDGYISKGKYLRGPLFTMPCEIKKVKSENKENIEYIINPLHDKAILNTMLLMEICKYNNIELDDEFIGNIEIKKDNDEKDIIKQVFTNIGAKYYINNEYTAKEDMIFVKFKNYSNEDKPTLDEFIEENRFRLTKNMILGIFNKNKASIYNNYLTLINKSKNKENMGLLQDILTSEFDEDIYDEFNKKVYNVCNKIHENDKYFLSQLDFSQEEAVLSIDNKKIVTIEGPPGTGKSEVIASIISNNIMKNKTILMVCEKNAALKVILDKYINKELDKYITHITDIKNINNFKKKLYEDIIEINNKNIKDLNSDMINLNNIIQNNMNKLDEINKQLYSKEFGMSLYELYGYPSEDVERVSFNIDFPSAKFDISTLKNIKLSINIIAQNVSKLNRNELVNKINDDVNLRSVDIRLDKISEINEDLNKSNALELVKNLYDVYRDKSSIILDIEQYEIYLNNKPSLINKFKSKLFELFKLNSIVNKLNIDISRLEDKVFIKQELNLIKKATNLHEELHKEIENLSILFSDEYINTLKNNIYDYNKFKYHLEQISDLIEKIDYLSNVKDQKSTLGIYEKQLIDVLIKNEVGIRSNIDSLGEYWYKIIQNELVISWIKFLESKYNLASSISSYDEIRKDLLNSLMIKTRAIPKEIEIKIINNINNLEDDKMKNLQKNIKKSNKKISNKQFISECIENGLLRYKPIWLLTPEVATSILPLQPGLFDIVIFDEASQMALEYSIPCIYRAKKIVVAGDTKQLPPPKINDIGTDIEDFDNIDIDEDKELFYNSESLLHYMIHKYNNSKVFLNYHYRSKYKELINFSNYAFYGGEINIVPNAFHSKDNKPIEYIFLEDGRINNSVNLVEARKVVDVLNDAMIQYKEESIAIIAFTKAQQKCIENEITKRKQSNPEFAMNYSINANRRELDKRILISNIDEIQGYQRDIVIFSIAYGPRENNGQMSGNIMGSLNSKDGKFRLNVAISRAKKKIVLITSLKGHMIPPSEEGEGRSLLISYLNYCEAVYLNEKENIKDILEEVCSYKNRNNSKHNNKDESPLETQIRESLILKGVRLDQQVEQLGFRIDFAVIDPRDSNKYLLAIEADGATYHSSKSAKERDLYRQQLLEEKGWTFMRIWSRDWWKDKESEIQKILNKINELTKINN